MIPLQSFPAVFERDFNYLSSLSTSNMSLINAEAGAIFTVVVACLALEAIMKDQVEQLNKIRVPATAIGIN